MSEYYRKYGNPNFGGIKGILTESRKRMYKQIRQKRRKISEQSEDGIKEDTAKNPWGALSETWGLNDAVENEFNIKSDHKEQGRSVKDRLGFKSQSRNTSQIEEGSSSASSDSEDEWCKRSKVLRMRMHADDEEEKIHKRRAKLKTQLLLNSMSNNIDLRSRLGRRQKERQYHDAIQVVVTNTKATRTDAKKLSVSEEEDGEIVEDVQQDEKEEGEWHESDEEVEEEQQEEANDSESSDVSAKEVQGPKGSVIKVVQHKPRVASTVWTRLNNVKSVVHDNGSNERQSRGRDLRDTLKSGDLRSRIGQHVRGRSQLRIEVKNDKYTEEGSGIE